MGKHTKPHTGKLFQPTDDQRRQVLTMTGFGIQQDEIANALEIDRKTLAKHFRRELDTGMTEANVRVAQALYTNAVKNMNVAAQIWWTKTRMGWKEAQDLNIGGTNTPLNVSFRWADAALPNPEHAQDATVTWIEAEAEPAE
jgi:hypothetical protein